MDHKLLNKLTAGFIVSAWNIVSVGTRHTPDVGDFSMSGIFEKIVDLAIKSPKRGWFKEYEIRGSVVQLAERWNFLLSEEEKKKVCRIIGGNRYAKSCRLVLDSIMSEIDKEHKSIGGRNGDE